MDCRAIFLVRALTRVKPLFAYLHWQLELLN